MGHDSDAINQIDCRATRGRVGCSPCGRPVDAAEDHAARGRLQHAGDRDGHFLADAPALLDDHHGAVVEIADALADLVALLDDLHVQASRPAGRPA